MVSLVANLLIVLRAQPTSNYDAVQVCQQRCVPRKGKLSAFLWRLITEFAVGYLESYVQEYS